MLMGSDPMMTYYDDPRLLSCCEMTKRDDSDKCKLNIIYQNRRLVMAIW